MILTPNNIKAELSYAYLHAVAARGGLECVVAGRHSDGAGVDAILRARERFTLSGSSSSSSCPRMSRNGSATRPKASSPGAARTG